MQRAGFEPAKALSQRMSKVPFDQRPEGPLKSPAFDRFATPA